MTTDNHHNDRIENHHGVLLNIAGSGVLIIGDAGIGKSSLALEYLHAGHSLIADDCIDFKLNKSRLVIGSCPEMLSGLLHTRELGLISLADIFPSSAWQTEIPLHTVIRLQKNRVSANTLSLEPEIYRVCGQTFPLLTLDINTPATLLNRINTWLRMQASTNNADVTLSQRQHAQMKATLNRETSCP